MQFSVNFRSKYIKEADEVRCPWNQLGLIMGDLHTHPTVRLCVTIPAAAKEEEFDFDKLFSQLALVAPMVAELTVCVPGFEFFRKVHDEKLYSAFFSFPVTDWETFNAFLSIGVSDIWIDGPLCFQANTLTRVKEDYAVNIRISPVTSSFFAITEKRPVTSFYLRPEDTGDFPADIIDFHATSQEREDTLYQIYKRGTFIFDIANLIPGLPESITNAAFDEKFAATRANCRQTCQIPGHTCHYCQNYFKSLSSMASLLSLK